MELLRGLRAGTPGAAVTPTSEPWASSVAGSVVYAATVDGLVGAQFNSAASNAIYCATLPASLTEWRMGWYVTFDSSGATPTSTFLMAYLRSGSTLIADVGLRNASGNRFVAFRDNFVFNAATSTSGDNIPAGATWRIEWYYLNGASTISVWKSRHSTGAADYVWNDAALSTGGPYNIVVGPDTNTGVSAKITDFWLSSGESLEGVAPAAASSPAHLNVIQGASQKQVPNVRVIVGGAKKLVPNMWVIEGGLKRPLVASALDRAVTFYDDFSSGTLDSTKWNARTESQSYSDAYALPAQVSIRSGQCVLTATKAPYTTGGGTTFPWRTGYIDTIGKFSQKYGLFEARMKLPTTLGNSAGLWPSWWMRPTAITTALASAINSSVTTMTLATSLGIPAVPFTATVESEQVRVTAVSGSTLTVTRGYNSTTAVSHATGATVALPNALGEIDFMEAWGEPVSNHTGKVPGSATFTLHEDTNSGAGSSDLGTTIPGPGGARIDADWHVYGCEWSPSGFTYYLDGNVIVSKTNAQLIALGFDLACFNSPFHMRLHLAIGKSSSYWGPPDTNTQNPAEQLIDWVRVLEPLP